MKRAAFAIVTLTMLYLAIAGSAKLLDLVGFGLSLRRAGVLPAPIVSWVIMIVPTVEFVVGLSWLLGLCRRAGAAAAALMLMLFTGYIVSMIAEGSTGGCGCLGGLVADVSWLERPWVALVRNGLMIVALGAYLVTGGTPGARARTAPADAPGRETACGRGFTVLELVLLVAMVAVLMALLAPQLSGARDRARMVATEALLRQHAQVMKGYSTDYRGYFPYMVNANVSLTVLRSEIAGARVACRYFDAFTRWHVALADAYYNGQIGASLFLEPARGALGDGPVLNTGFIYPCVFLAAPEYWDPTTRTAGIGQLGAVRDAQVLYPADKALISTDTHSWAGGPLRRMDTAAAFVDGHAEVRKADELLDGYSERFNPERWGGHTTGSAIGSTPLIHTVRGVRGRDRP